MRVRGNPRAQVVRIGARLDAGTSAGVRERLHKALDSGDGDLILDLSKLEMIDATGLGVLVGSHRRALSVQRRLVLSGGATADHADTRRDPAESGPACGGSSSRGGLM